MHSLITMLFVIFYMGLLAISRAYVNVALNKPVYQQYQLKPGDDRYDASNAVDGRKSDLSLDVGQCAVSYSRSTATWWVNLIGTHGIHHITIYFRTENSDDQFRSLIAGYVLGFSVYVSNTTERSQGTLCFKDENFTRNTIPSVFTTNCFVNGQYVIFYNERLPGVVYPDDYYSNVWSDLCEVEVNVCPVGLYGIECKQICGYCRNVSHCHHINGACSSGCDAGYKGNSCKTPCPNGFYGQDCSEKCNDTCAGCNHVSGVCDSGCVSGWMGHSCNQRCPSGSYWLACTLTCGNCRDVNQCNHINGTCLTGCSAGYMGNLCKTPCPRGFFGQDCSEKCNDTCAGCNNVNGVCDSGCIPGWNGYIYNKDGRLNERNIEFYSLVGALCLSTIIIIVLIIYQRMERRNHKNQSTDDTPLRHTTAVANQEGAAFGSYMNSVEVISCRLYNEIQEDKM